MFLFCSFCSIVNACIELCVPWKGIVYFQGMGLQCYKLVFQETESISFWIFTVEMAVVLVHFREKIYEIYESSDAALMRRCQRKLMFSVEKEQALISKKAS